MIKQGGIIPDLPKYAGDTLKLNQIWGKKCEKMSPYHRKYWKYIFFTKSAQKTTFSQYLYMNIVL